MSFLYRGLRCKKVGKIVKCDDCVKFFFVSGRRTGRYRLANGKVCHEKSHGAVKLPSAFVYDILPYTKKLMSFNCDFCMLPTNFELLIQHAVLNSVKRPLYIISFPTQKQH